MQRALPRIENRTYKHSCASKHLLSDPHKGSYSVIFMALLWCCVIVAAVAFSAEEMLLDYETQLSGASSLVTLNKEAE